MDRRRVPREERLEQFRKHGVGKDAGGKMSKKQDVVRQAMLTSVRAMVDYGDQVIGCVLLGDFNLEG